jgi:hypothetical protein
MEKALSSLLSLGDEEIAPRPPIISARCALSYSITLGCARLLQKQEDAGDAGVGLVRCTGSVLVVTAKPEPGGSDSVWAQDSLASRRRRVA